MGVFKMCLTQRGIAVIAMLALASFGISGCGKSERLVDQAIKDKILYINSGSDVTTLDPQLVQSDPDSKVVGALFEGLVQPDTLTLAPQPAGASHWEISEDGLRYRFFLRPQAQFSDGVSVTAHTYVGSVKRGLSPALAAPYSHFLFFLKNAQAYYNGEVAFDAVGVKAIDTYTLEFTLDHPIPYFLSALQYPIFYPVPLHLLERLGTVDERNVGWTRPGMLVSNGAFTLEGMRPNASTIVAKNPNYWDASAVRLNRIVFNATQSVMIDERMFKGGLVHRTMSVPAIKTKQYLESRPAHFHHGPMYATFYLMMNVTREPLGDQRIREALSLAIDRRAITDSVLRGGQLVASGMVAPDETGFKSLTQSAFDPERARALLQAAGFGPDKPFPRLRLLYNISDDREKIATAIQQMWEQHLGIKVQLGSQEWKVFLDSQDKLNYDISVRAWKGDYIHPNTFLEIFMSNSENNGTGWTSAAYDALMQQAYREPNSARNMQLLAEAEKILIDEAAVVPLYHFTKGYLLDTRVRGMDQNVAEEIVFKNVYFAED